MTHSKPTYYIWKTDEMKQEEYEYIKNYWTSLGFRTVTFVDGSSNKDINEGLKAVIKNHITSDKC
ncbi:hypothetical protein [Anaerocolumna sp. MB42-C2]|uniref:hypothetical protein n=1 Tax=Anaerocolumna sp. MB42-C2 TaxID=3070997 RepID=UPI0027DFD167|nr:hypothetical protein [Anaerocolumna sp. MB42-C2]WMJ89340.1 hypothetical protein RBU59_07390 [Anaerocolumna sp. MB42-C2]